MKPQSEEKKPETVGEELYLIHLRRHEGEEPRPEDFDHEESVSTNKKRSGSVGEELWYVHLKRSRGMKPDLDTEGIINEMEKQKAEVSKTCRYNLRRRTPQVVNKV